MQRYNFSRLFTRQIDRKVGLRLDSPTAVGILYFAEPVKGLPDLVQVVCHLRLPGPRTERVKTGFTYLATDGDDTGLSQVKNPARYQQLIQLRQAIWLTVAQHIRRCQYLDTATLRECCNRFRDSPPATLHTDWYFGQLLATSPSTPRTIEEQRADILLIDVLRFTISSPFIKLTA